MAACQASLSITNSWNSLRLRSIQSVMLSSHLILFHPLLLLPSIPPSIRVFSNESVLRIRWPKFWSFSFSISLSNEYSELISSRIDWFDLLVVQETLTSLLQHHCWKVSTLQCSAFFIVQLSKILWCNKSSSKREVYRNTILPQETIKTLTRKPNFTSKTTWKRTTTKKKNNP